MYFNRFPKINYKFTNEDGTIDKDMQDIFRRVSIKKEVLDNPSNFNFHIVNDGDTPEQVAFNLYGDSGLWWIILLSNQINNVDQEWVKGTMELNRLFSEFLKGQSLYIMDDLDIQNDDVVVRRDGSESGSLDINTWGIIKDYDKFYHKIDIMTENSSGTFSKNDEFYVYRNTYDGYMKIDGFGATACAVQGIGQTGCAQVSGINVLEGPTAPHCPCATAGIQGATFSTINRVESLTDSLSHFESGGDLINPYTMIDGNSPKGISGNWYVPGGNLCGLTATFLYKWVIDSPEGFPETGNTPIKSISRGADIIRQNDKKRRIKVLAVPVVDKVIREFESLLSKNIPPGTTKYLIG